MKKIVFMLITALMALSSCFIASAADIKVIVNNSYIDMPQPPVNVEGTTFVPLRAIVEAMECDILWVDETKTANIRNSTTIVAMQIGNSQITRVKKDDASQTDVIDCPMYPRIINGSTYIPLRAMAECFGAQVQWYPSGLIEIIYDESLNYVGNKTVTTYASTGLSYPNSVAATDDGRVYATDKGDLLEITGGKKAKLNVPKVTTTGEETKVKLVRTNGQRVYLLLDESVNNRIIEFDDGKIVNSILMTDCSIDDFTVDSQGRIYVLLKNFLDYNDYLARVTFEDSKVETLLVNPKVYHLTVDDKDNLFLCNEYQSVIYYYNASSSEISVFAGKLDYAKFVDGNSPYLFQPMALSYDGGYLYIFDYCSLRRIKVDGNSKALYAETVAGKVHTRSEDAAKEIVNGDGKSAVLQAFRATDLCVKNGSAYLAEGANGCVRLIK